MMSVLAPRAMAQVESPLLWASSCKARQIIEDLRGVRVEMSGPYRIRVASSALLGPLAIQRSVGDGRLSRTRVKPSRPRRVPGDRLEEAVCTMGACGDAPVTRASCST